MVCFSSFFLLKADEKSKQQEQADRLFKREDLTPLRRYRQHFSSITCWAFYGPWNLDDRPFKANYLLISGDRFNQIFISDAITGEVFREYDCFVPKLPLFALTWEEAEEADREDDENDDDGYEWNREREDLFYPRCQITHLEFSPQFRLFAYCERDGSNDNVHVRETLTGKHFGFKRCNKILSVAFRSEPLNGNDVLEIFAKNHDGSTYREYYAFPLVASQHVLSDIRKSGLRGYRLENLDGIFKQGTEIYFPVYKKDAGGTIVAGPKGLEQSFMVWKNNYEIQTKSMLGSQEKWEEWEKSKWDAWEKNKSQKDTIKN